MKDKILRIHYNSCIWFSSDARGVLRGLWRERLSLKRVVIVGVVLLVVVAVVYRQRLFLRDPLGKVERNGIRVDGASVFINYYNDVLIQNGMPGRSYWCSGEVCRVLP